MDTVCHGRFELLRLFGEKATGGFDDGAVNSDGEESPLMAMKKCTNSGKSCPPRRTA